jgi:general secretion pathway protein G
MFKERLGRRLHEEQGFTLIEIIVVMVILAVLATLIVPRFAGRTEQARRSKAIADIANIKVALDMYEADNGSYPSTEQGLQALREASASDPVPKDWKGPYLKDPILDDPWGQPYIYSSPGENNPDSYDLLSYGKDGKEGGTGEDEDIYSWNLPNKSSNGQ